MKTSFLLLVAVVLMVPRMCMASDAVLRPGDTFELKIGGIPPDDATLIGGTCTIDGDGLLNLTYIGKIRAAGLTPSEVQSSVEHAYVSNGIFTHPTVTINIASTSRLVSVGGEVNNKGRIPYTPDMTIMSAIAAAGDFTIYANQAHVRLIRGNTVKEVNCKKIRNNPSLDEKVLPGDNIQVPQAFF